MFKLISQNFMQFIDLVLGALAICLLIQKISSEFIELSRLNSFAVICVHLKEHFSDSILNTMIIVAHDSKEFKIIGISYPINLSS